MTKRLNIIKDDCKKCEQHLSCLQRKQAQMSGELYEGMQKMEINVFEKED